MMQATITTAVPLTSACWLGHSTFLSSAQASPTKCAAPAAPRRRWRLGAQADARAARPRAPAATGPGGRDAADESSAPTLRVLVTCHIDDCRGIHLVSALASLPVNRVAPAPPAVLLELDPVGRVPLGLLGLVVAPLALRARKGDSDSYSCGHFLSLPSKDERVDIAPGGLEPPTSAL